MRADVVVFGGGPAGIGTALALTEQRVDVVVVERSQYDGIRIGETLPPIVQSSLARLGLWDDFLALDAIPSSGIRSVWGSTEPFDRSFLFDPYGHGWHIDRPAFDRMLAAAAEARGVRVLRGHRLLGWERTDDGWKLRLGAAGASVDVSARLLVDATGRASAIGRKLGARRASIDAAVAVYGFFAPRAPLEPVALVEAAECGWWYSAPLPAGRLAVAVVTDRELIRPRSPRDEDHWRSMLAQAPETERRVRGRTLEGGLLPFSAACSRLAPAAGEGWLAVGDAALARDPLAGDGVHRALEQAAQAAEAIASWISGDRSAVGRYRALLDRDFDAHVARRLIYYAREQRWGDAPFWAHRRGAGATLGSMGSERLSGRGRPVLA